MAKPNMLPYEVLQSLRIHVLMSFLGLARLRGLTDIAIFNVGMTSTDDLGILHDTVPIIK